jgi:hypothetical protein
MPANSSFDWIQAALKAQTREELEHLSLKLEALPPEAADTPGVPEAAEMVAMKLQGV